MKKLPFIILLLTASCTVTPKLSTSKISNTNGVIDGKIFATAYMQNAAEYRALCFQAFNIAHKRIEEMPLAKTEKPRAIITDIDETILNNSAYEVHQTLQGKDYEGASWHQWALMENADTVPGSLTFLKFASSQGIEIFYVTNRGEKERDVTLKNLQKFNFPNADTAHLFPNINTSSKEVRRQFISSTHDVIMLMGDNLGDFSSLFDKKNKQERAENVNSVAAEFGDRFIVLPNPVYGDWETSLYHYDYSLTQAQKDSIVRASVKGY
ncbi:MAG: 5'-nucleotidase, lipoprotein e(P4) family [Bacteroidota bacterium]|nr:5'-nucleotidase, lipoprotein e(P4) family [Bacteroidota bacterium]